MDLTRYIKLETATLAKELGYDPRALGIVDTLHHLNVVFVTQSALQKWLRETHKIEVFIRKGYGYEWYIDGWTNVDGSEMGDGTFNTYEEALEEGLIKGLELLKLIKK